MITTYVLMFCRITTAFLFLFSFGRKIRAPRDLAVTIGDFKLLPRRWSKPVAWLFLSGELLTFVLLTFDSLIGFLLAILLLAVFSTALVTALMRHIDMQCNCFGRTERSITPYDVVRNLLLILCSSIGLWMLGYTTQTLSGGLTTLVALMSVVFLVLVTNLEEIVETLRQPFPVHEERS